MTPLNNKHIKEEINDDSERFVAFLAFKELFISIILY